MPAHQAAATAAEVAKPTFAENLIGSAQSAWERLANLDPREAGLNLLMSAAVVLVAAGLLWLFRHLFDRVLARFADETSDDAKRAPKAAGVTWLLVRLTVIATALVLVGGVWGVDLIAWLTGEGGNRLFRLTLILVLTTALIETAGLMIGRLIEGFAKRSGDRRRAAQIRSLGPLLKGSVQGVLLVVGLLTFLSEVGVKVGPLMASAGVLGIAVGFGAQTLVKDFLTGLFLIAEDVVSVGDNVRIGDAAGTVEAMTVRTIRLRSANGTLHIFPYSEAQIIHNRTKIFSSYLFEIVVSYDSDIDRALEVMQATGDEICADPAYAPMITKPFELLGVDRLGESGVTLKGRLTTQPRDQWKVGREYNRRLKNAFDAAGVQGPFQTIQIMPTPTPVDVDA